MVDNYGNSYNYGYQQDNQDANYDYQQDNQGYYPDPGYQDGYNQNGQNNGNWYQAYHNGEFDKPLPEGSQQEKSSDFQFNGPESQKATTAQSQASQNQDAPELDSKPMKRNMTTVDDDIRA